MIPASPTATRATLADLMHVAGKAELIAGRIVEFMSTGHRPSRIASRIFRSLDAHAEATGVGLAYNDNTGFTVPELASGRESFSPDAAYYLGAVPANDMDFLAGPPVLAVEVRSKNDYGPAAEAALAAKRADYFEAGTAVFWAVDPQAQVIRSYLATDPARPLTFAAGQTAHAEPVVPGWSLAVDRILA